jgi:hypothetical protein
LDICEDKSADVGSDPFPSENGTDDEFLPSIELEWFSAPSAFRMATKSFDEFDGTVGRGVVEIESAFMAGLDIAGVSFIGEAFERPDRSMGRRAFPFVG